MTLPPLFISNVLYDLLLPWENLSQCSVEWPSLTPWNRIVAVVAYHQRFEISPASSIIIMSSLGVRGNLGTTWHLVVGILSLYKRLPIVARGWCLFEIREIVTALFHCSFNIYYWLLVSIICIVTRYTWKCFTQLILAYSIHLAKSLTRRRRAAICMRVFV